VALTFYGPPNRKPKVATRCLPSTNYIVAPLVPNPIDHFGARLERRRNISVSDRAAVVIGPWSRQSGFSLR
jgi:hypothetical protein